VTIPPHGDDQTVKSRLILWLLCGVGLGILPVIANLISPVFMRTDFSISGPLADGELLLSSAAIAGAALGELFQSNINNVKAQARANLCLGFTILFCALCSIAYALTKASNHSAERAPSAAAIKISDSTNSQALTGPALASVVLFMLTIATAGSCIRLAAQAREVS
jgi:hypothetical protein